MLNEKAEANGTPQRDRSSNVEAAVVDRTVAKWLLIVARTLWERRCGRGRDVDDGG